MALLVLIFAGATLGWLASILVRTEDVPGILKNIGLGALAAVVGGLAMNGGAVLGGIGLAGLGVAVLAAIVLLGIYNAVFVVKF